MKLTTPPTIPHPEIGDMMLIDLAQERLEAQDQGRILTKKEIERVIERFKKTGKLKPEIVEI
jgi:hypothetical protein